MRLFKKFGLFAFMTFLFVGILSTSSFSSPNKSHNIIENNVSTVAKAQHVFDANPKGAATENVDPEEVQNYLSSSTYKCEVSKVAYSDLSVHLTGKITTESGRLFSIGWYSKDENYKPAEFSVQLQDENGNVLPDRYTGEVVVGGKSSSNLYLSTYYQSELQLEGYIQIPAKTKIVSASLELKNIFYVVEESTQNEDGSWNRKQVPLFDVTYTKAVALKKLLQTVDFSTFATITPTIVSEFCGYYAVSMKFENTLTIEKYLEINKLLNPIFQNGSNNVQNLEEGKTYINTRFILTKNHSNLIVEDLNGVTHTVAAIPSNFSTSEGVNNLVLNFPSEGIEGVKNFIIEKPMLTVSVINKETNKEVASSSFSYRFGQVSSGMQNIVDAQGNIVRTGIEAKTLNTDLLAGLITLAISLVTIGVIFGQYFYKKNKYANDEFKKVDTAAYFKTAVIAFFFAVVAGLDIYYLILRCGPLNNSELFANPVDIIVVVFTLVAFLLGCFFVRKYYIAFKEMLEKNRREKLNLNTKTEDDSGTISAQFAKPASNKKENN